MTHDGPVTDETMLVAAAIDRAYYRQQAGDIGEADPAAHFRAHGWRDGLNPTDWFDCHTYLRRNPDIALAGIDPFGHYLAHGRAEGRLPDRPSGTLGRVLDGATPPADRRPGYDAPPDAVRLSQAVLGAALAEAIQGAAGFVVSLSHDRYIDVTGGMQVLIGIEQMLFNADRVTYLHLSPAISRLTLGGDGPEFSWWQVVLDGRFLGLANDAAVISVIAALQGLPALRVLTIHSVFGHRIDPMLALALALRPRHSFFWLHDYASLCEGFTLMRNDLACCHAPPPASMACRVCVYGSGRPAYLAAIGRLFEGLVPHVLSPSRATLDIWLRASRLAWRTARVHDNAVLGPVVSTRPAGRPDQPVRVAFAGYPLTHKGWPLFLALLRATQGMDDYRFYHFAAAGALPAHDRLISVPTRVESTRPDAMTEALGEHGIDVLLVLSPWPETFSYVAHEGLAAGCDIVTLAVAGNVVDVVRRHGRGEIMADGDALVAHFTSGAAARQARAVSQRPLARLIPTGTTATIDPAALEPIDPRAKETADPGLVVLSGGRVLTPSVRSGGRRTALPDGTLLVRLRSRRQVPALVDAPLAPQPAGLAIAGIALDEIGVPPHDSRLLDFWHLPVGDVTWTDGDAWLRTDGAARLELTLCPGARYWQVPMTLPPPPRLPPEALPAEDPPS